MRVLYLAPPAGAPGTKLARYSFLHEEIHALAEAGIEVFVLVPEPAPSAPPGVQLRTWSVANKWRDLRDALFMYGRRFPHLSPLHLAQPRKLFQALRIEHLATKVIRDEQIDLIHSHFGWPKGFGGLIARRETGIPLVASLHGADILVDRAIDYGRGRDPFFARAVHQLLGEADRTLYYSDYMRRLGVQEGARANATSVVLWGIDLDAFSTGANREELRRELGLTARPTILSVAGLIQRKGIDTVLRALAQLREQHDFSFVVCGDGPELERLRQLSVELDLADRTLFAGRVDRKQITKYFAASDVFAHGALYEAAGIVLIEAMASGCPVVCTDAGGPAEYVQNERTGFVVPVRDADSMASKIAWLLDHPSEREQFGRAARSLAMNRFGRERMIRELIDVYKSVMQENACTHEPDIGAGV